MPHCGLVELVDANGLSIFAASQEMRLPTVWRHRINANLSLHCSVPSGAL